MDHFRMKKRGESPVQQLSVSMHENIVTDCHFAVQIKASRAEFVRAIKAQAILLGQADTASGSDRSVPSAPMFMALSFPEEW
ncbi:hypothetical protein [Bradyrhizobium yuanmingense]|uniref:hypothetical protein n=1 Tax=Bradyrhizobium yuanmingense TaxID=108015 RepID=UPI0023B8EE57|nr:hypothetical protein [Bradyrhizobium yuanmingense]MDF0494642.1 hypothetical protein [Bradyrhizobium yuanmingense]